MSKSACTMVLIAAGAVACGKSESPSVAQEKTADMEAEMYGRDEAPGAPAGAAAPASPAPEEARPRGKMMAKKLGLLALEGAAGGGGVGLGGLGLKGRGGIAAIMEADVTTVEEPAATRAWFPETFLFEPLVATDAAGKGVFAAKVPDRLTTWRVLALAHTRSGGLAGGATSFLGTLPVYVDPIVPAFLVAGDRVKLPIQVVNTTDAAVTETLRVSVEGGRIASAAPSTVRLGPRGSTVVFAEVEASGRAKRAAGQAVGGAGQLALRVVIGRADAVERTIEVRPSGRPIEQSRGGTLAAPRAIELTGPERLDPESARARLVVYPGALAVLRSELASAADRGGVAGDAYALLLAGRGPKLLRSLGEEPDEAALRKLGLIASQRVLRHARAPDLATSALLAEAALTHPSSPILSRLGARLVSTVQAAQRPDGTFGGAQGWTLQRLLVTTAEGVRAALAGGDSPEAKRRSQAVLLRASFAFERHLARVDDPYTAAAIVASGAVDGSVADGLRARVREAVVTREDGARVLPVPKGVVRSDGLVPSEAEATAIAVLALAGDEQAKPWRADLGASLLAAYTPSLGWGDGRANLACLRAVLDLFSEPIPSEVRITLALDGETIAEGRLDASRAKEVLTMSASARGAAGPHRWTVRADPPVPGLGFSLSLLAWVPWEHEPASSGLDLRIGVPDDLRAGRAADVELAATAPAGLPLVIRCALPAGVDPDARALDALVSAGTIARHESHDGLVTLHVAALRPGQAFSAKLRVIPTLAGSLQALAWSVAVEGRPHVAHHVPPRAWTVR